MKKMTVAELVASLLDEDQGHVGLRMVARKLKVGSVLPWSRSRYDDDPGEGQLMRGTSAIGVRDLAALPKALERVGAYEGKYLVVVTGRINVDEPASDPGEVVLRDAVVAGVFRV